MAPGRDYTRTLKTFTPLGPEAVTIGAVRIPDWKGMEVAIRPIDGGVEVVAAMLKDERCKKYLSILATTIKNGVVTDVRFYCLGGAVGRYVRSVTLGGSPGGRGMAYVVATDRAQSTPWLYALPLGDPRKVRAKRVELDRAESTSTWAGESGELYLMSYGTAVTSRVKVQPSVSIIDLGAGTRRRAPLPTECLGEHSSLQAPVPGLSKAPLVMIASSRCGDGGRVEILTIDEGTLGKSDARKLN